MNLLYPFESPFEAHLSFDKVIEELAKKVSDQSSENFPGNQSLLQDIYLHPELKNGITDINQITRNEPVIRRMLIDYFPPGLDLNEIKAVSMPYSNLIFNQSQRFRNILRAAGPDFEINIKDFTEHQFYVSCCCIILNEFYGTNLSFSKPLLYEIPTANGITKYYRILYNGDFMNIKPTEKALTLTETDIEQLLNSYDDLELWKEKFPPKSWISTGFAIMTLTDATIENAVSMLKEKLLGKNDADFRQSIESIFQSMFLLKDIRVGFAVYNKQDDKFSTETFGQHLPSYILGGETQMDAKAVLCQKSYTNLIEKQTFFTVSDCADFFRENPGSYLADQFINQNIQSFILAPIFKDQRLFGFLEVVSTEKKALNSINANRLNVVMPFLTDTIVRYTSELQNQVQAVIQDKYTTIHESVYWKFYKEATRYVLDEQNKKRYSPQEISFPDVYPLYGQIDIKGSSEVRNFSIQNDLKKQLRTLIDLLQKIGGGENSITLYQQEIQHLENFYQDVSSGLKSSTELYVTNYLDGIHAILREMKQPEFITSIQAYFAKNEKTNGVFHTYRRKYETTMSMINTRMTAIIDRWQAEAQLLFPHYYERFVTDGVEHNLYIGASIWPKAEFDISKLYELRFWQLKVLCEMEVAHNRLKPSLPYSMDVTTLILVYQSTIGIRFRMDEKRFDFDGSYNARFEIVKKRIDKAYVKGTRDRITQAGKLTIVYSSDIEEKEYLQYLRTLQSANVLGHEIENLEVEDLQGVSGLRVLRVAICHD